MAEPATPPAPKKQGSSSGNFQPPLKASTSQRLAARLEVERRIRISKTRPGNSSSSGSAPGLDGINKQQPRASEEPDQQQLVQDSKQSEEQPGAAAKPVTAQNPEEDQRENQADQDNEIPETENIDEGAENEDSPDIGEYPDVGEYTDEVRQATQSKPNQAVKELAEIAAGKVLVNWLYGFMFAIITTIPAMLALDAYVFIGRFTEKPFWHQLSKTRIVVLAIVNFMVVVALILIVWAILNYICTGFSGFFIKNVLAHIHDVFKFCGTLDQAGFLLKFK